ncbi:LOW QUALITY PROTEIN: tetratricopeptide repeat protein 22 [Cariama cristata]
MYYIQALAWSYLGMLLERKEMFSTSLTGIQDCGFSETDPLNCFGKVIEMAKDILNRLAKTFLLGKQEVAKGICNMALEVLRDPQLSWQVNCTWAQAMEFGLGDTLPKLQLCRGMELKSQETLAIECFKLAIELDDVGSTKCLQCLLETLLVLFGRMTLKTETLMQEVEQWVKEAEGKFPRQRLQQELRAVCCNRTLEGIQVCKALRGRTELVKLLFETVKVDSSKGRKNKRSLSL